MANTIQIKRGDKADLPTLAAGELGFCADVDPPELYIGDGIANHQVALDSAIKDYIDAAIDAALKKASILGTL